MYDHARNVYRYTHIVHTRAGRGEHGNNREGIPGLAVPGGCCHCENHEDEENTSSQPASVRVSGAAPLPCQGEPVQLSPTDM